jgi:hypothetical protein
VNTEGWAVKSVLNQISACKLLPQSWLYTCFRGAWFKYRSSGTEYPGRRVLICIPYLKNCRLIRLLCSVCVPNFAFYATRVIWRRPLRSLWGCCSVVGRRYATSLKVTGSRPGDANEFCNLPNPSGRTRLRGLLSL